MHSQHALFSTAYLSFDRWAHHPLEVATVIARFLEAPPPT